MTVRISWLVTSPRLPAGVLTLQAWDTLRAAEVVRAAAATPLVEAIRQSGVDVSVVAAGEAEALLLSEGGVWIAGADGDEALARRISERIASHAAGLEVELVYGSWDPPGARLLDVVAVVDRLRSPGGCPWDAAQTHASLAPFLLEEAYETIDAIDSDDLGHLREELGDLLLQPLLHARFASESDEGFSIDDVAGDAVDKLIRRHPHVFAEDTADSLEELKGNWESIKRVEKPDRQYATDGVVTAQPALSLAAKYLSRVSRADLNVPEPDFPTGAAAATHSPQALGEALLALVSAARRVDIDPELALRAAALEYARQARAAEDADSGR